MSAKARPLKESQVVKVTAKKSPAKRVAIIKPLRKKSVSKKTSAKKKQATVKKNFSEKLEAKLNSIEIFHAAKPALKPTKALAIVKKKPLVQLSPYRFPYDIDTIVRQTARIGGLLFVVLGAALSILNAQLVNLESAQRDDATNVSATSLVQATQSASVSNAFVTKPEARFTVNTSGDLTGSVIVSVSVPGAQKVDLSVYDKTSRQVISLGTTVLRNGVFEYTWDTNLFHNGQYRLQALITNEYGTYEQIHTEQLTIQHPASTNEVLVDAEIVGDLDFTTDTTGRFITVRQTLPEVLVGHTIEVIVTNQTTGEQYRSVDYLLGYVYARYNIRWSHIVDTSSYSGGTYTITAVHKNVDEVIAVYQTEVTVSGSSTPTQPSPEISPISDQLPVLTIANPNLVSGFREIAIEATEASSIEVYAANRSSNVNILLGVARRQSDSYWSFNWDSRQIPNSTYQLFARVSNLRGIVETNRVTVSVSNNHFVPPSASQLQAMQSQIETYGTLFKGNILLDNNLWLSGDSEIVSEDLNEFITKRRDEIDALLQRYAAAVRSGNVDAITMSTTHLMALENAFQATIERTDNAEQRMSEFSRYIESARVRINADVKKVESVINERTDDGIFTDSDNDEITDFDEVFIFSTDPFSADTSKNGIPDGTAILNGLDPLSADIDASIVFESPKDIGVIRSDILKVASLTPVPVEVDPFTTEPRTGFVLTGNGLPNSFVTIYVFSQPIIVTVRTEADGSWQYRFEKELEDGSHSVYVALTDNSGRIIARSQPFFFTKVAQAFTVTGESFTDAQLTATQSNNNSLLNTTMIYLVISFAVVVVGLVLLLLGMYLEVRIRKDAPDLLGV